MSIVKNGLLKDEKIMAEFSSVKPFCPQKYYEKYDGFVILHGTDTMAYTASALSFMCEHLGKPIILTGSQVTEWRP